MTMTREMRQNPFSLIQEKFSKSVASSDYISEPCLQEREDFVNSKLRATGKKAGYEHFSEGR